ncbi:MAG TPA: S8 family serine peptidase, partial [Actinoplanes sp.]
VAATTTFQSYAQTGASGFPFSNGTWANGNISGLSSGGVTQHGRVPDLAAPGDLGWALCTPNVAIYEDCVDYKGAPSSIQNFGGTSQSSPFTAGAAALVIQAYESTHHGVRPAPALVKRLLTSTATDLGHPAYEQGAGQLNTLAAVKAALSFKDSNGSPKAQGSSLIVDKTQLVTDGQPGSTTTSKLAITNVSGNTQKVSLSTRTLGPVTSTQSGTDTLNTATAPAFVDQVGIPRSYVAQKFKVGIGADRLDFKIAAAADPFAVRIILIDPQGVYQAYSIPQGTGNFGDIDVRYPSFGTWTAYIGLSRSSGFNGPIKWQATTSNFTGFGSVSPSSLSLAPGATGTVKVTTKLPKNPGDVSASVQLKTPLGLATSVPLTARTVIPTSSNSNSFSGVLNGGNGRSGDGGYGQTNAYYLDVPKGKKDLGISISVKDPGVTYFGVLTSPDGQVYSYQSNLYADATGQGVNDKSLQIYRRNPQAGRWLLSVDFTNPQSGLEVAQPFTGKVTFNTVKVSASLPSGSTLKAGKAVSVPVKVTNTGAAPLTYFADARLNTVGDLPLVELSGAETTPLPVPAGVYPQWVVPTESKQLTVQAAATQPVNLDLFYSSGEPEVYSSAQGNGALVRVQAPQVSPGLWAADIGQTGPFAGPAPAGTVTTAAVAQGQLFDPAVTSSTGDFWQLFVGSGDGDQAALATIEANAKAGRYVAQATGSSTTAAASTTAATGPVILKPGQSATITVTITPSAAKGSTVKGHLYVDTVSQVTLGGDELIDLPYSYKVG